MKNKVGRVVMNQLTGEVAGKVGVLWGQMRGQVEEKVWEKIQEQLWSTVPDLVMPLAELIKQTKELK